MTTKIIQLFRISQINHRNSQILHSTIEDIYIASVDTGQGKGQRDLLRIFDIAGLQGSSAEVLFQLRSNIVNSIANQIQT